MRIIGFSKKWPKLSQDEFTTFRLPRKDKDWLLNESVQVVYHPRSKDRELLGVVDIIAKEQKWANEVTSQEAIADGFPGGSNEMWFWLWKSHGERLTHTRLNKLTLRWRSHHA